jgi:hypothetical protein
MPNSCSYLYMCKLMYIMAIGLTTGYWRPPIVVGIGMLLHEPSYCNCVLQEKKLDPNLSILCLSVYWYGTLFSTDVIFVTAAFLFPSSLNPDILQGLLGSGQSISKLNTCFSFQFFISSYSPLRSWLCYVVLTLHDMLPFAFDYLRPESSCLSV